MAFCSSSLVVNAAGVRVSLGKEGRGALLTFLPRAGPIQILPPGKPGTPPCKSGQLEKELGLEASSARHAARLIISEIMRSFFRWFKCSSPHGTRTTLTRRMMRCGLTSADSGLQVDLEIALNGVSAKIQPPPVFSSAESALRRRMT